jgi:hypothetical protein
MRIIFVAAIDVAPMLSINRFVFFYFRVTDQHQQPHSVLAVATSAPAAAPFSATPAHGDLEGIDIARRRLGIMSS